MTAPHGEHTDPDGKKINAHIEMVEREGFEHHHPHQLSGGMPRRAEPARALAVTPDILIMDEPIAASIFRPI